MSEVMQELFFYNRSSNDGLGCTLLKKRRHLSRAIWYVVHLGTLISGKGLEELNLKLNYMCNEMV